MAKPTVAELRTRVMKAFGKIGFGGKFSTYSVYEKERDIICLNKVGGVVKHYMRVLCQEELDYRACDLQQSRYADVSETFTHLKDNDIFVVYRLVQNMFAKLHGTTMAQHFYYDPTKDSIIAKCGKVIIEIELILNHTVDISTNALYDYLQQLEDFVDGAAESRDAKMFTMYGVLRITLDNGDIVYPQISVQDFKRHWEV